MYIMGSKPEALYVLLMIEGCEHDDSYPHALLNSLLQHNGKQPGTDTLPNTAQRTLKYDWLGQQHCHKSYIYTSLRTTPIQIGDSFARS